MEVIKNKSTEMKIMWCISVLFKWEPSRSHIWEKERLSDWQDLFLFSHCSPPPSSRSIANYNKYHMATSNLTLGIRSNWSILQKNFACQFTFTPSTAKDRMRHHSQLLMTPEIGFDFRVGKSLARGSREKEWKISIRYYFIVLCACYYCL